MAAIKAASTTREQPSVEYSVYIFHRPFHLNDNHITWEKRHTTSSIQAAYAKALSLYESQEYERVEIKKKFFDEKQKRHIDKTLKIYAEGRDRPVGLLGLWASTAAAVCLAVAAWFKTRL